METGPEGMGTSVEQVVPAGRAEAVGGGRWRGRLPYVLGGLLIALCINNGFWQLRRHDYKQGLQARYDAATTAQPITEPTALQAAQRVSLRGRWVTEATVFLDNRSYQGRPGFHVLTPLQLSTGSGSVMIDRGWIAVGADRRQLPHPPTPAGEVEVQGRVIEPAVGGFTLGESAAEPRVWQRVDPQRFTTLVTGPVASRYVQQDNASDDGLVRDWPRPDFGVEKHLGYAFQWFSFAVMTMGWMLWFGWRRVKRARA